MNLSNSSKKVYLLTPYWRFYMIGLGIMVGAMPVGISRLSTPTDPGDFFFVFLFYAIFIGIAGFLIYYALTTRLIVSFHGIQAYHLYPFHTDIAWDEIDMVQIHKSGNINLMYKSEKKKTLSRMTNGVAITLSSYVDDWQNNELVRDIQSNASHVKWQPNILNKPILALWYRPSFIVVYYVVSMIIPLLLAMFLASISIKPFRIIWEMATVAWIGGIAGGMQALLPYSKWMDLQMKKGFKGKIKKAAIFLYTAPFRSWLIVLTFGLLVQLLFSKSILQISENYPGIYNGLGLCLGYVLPLFAPFARQRK